MSRVRVEIRERHKLMFLLCLGVMLSVLFMGTAGEELRQLVRGNGQQVVGRLRYEAQQAGQQAEQQQAGQQQKSQNWEKQARNTVSVEGGNGKDLTVIAVRIVLPLVWILLSFTVVGALSLYMFWVFLGFSVGVLAWTMICVEGWRGPFGVWALVFPQYLCYLPALLLLYIACLRWHAFWREHRRYLYTGMMAPQMRLFLLRSFLALLIYGGGIWLEIHINPWILKKTL